MKNKTSMVAITLLAVMFIASCAERVAPNYYGVLMENYGKSGKSDYSKQQGRVSTMAWGTELFQVPAFEQRAEFTDDEGKKRILKCLSSDNTEFDASPMYSYKVKPDMVVDVVFQNARLGADKNFMSDLEDNILEPHIYDLLKEESRRYKTDDLMAEGGNLKFEDTIQKKIRQSFAEKGLELITFSCNLGFSKKVKDKIDSRNEVNTNVTLIDQQIIEQRKKNELEDLQTT